MSLRRRPPPLVLIGSVALVLGTAGCGVGAGNETSEQSITVYAAASLSGTFTEIGRQFELQHPGVTVSFNFGGSADLVAQIHNGAPADVFASADEANMAKLTADHLESAAPTTFASNTLEIITPPDNPGEVDGLEDLADPDLAIAVCAPEVPCGRAALAVASAAGVTLAPDTEEQSVKDVVAKVASGEADAGLVYVTDVRAAASTVHGITFPESAAGTNLYPITALKDSKDLTLASQFVGFVTGAQGQAILDAAGFAAAPR